MKKLALLLFLLLCLFVFIQCKKECQSKKVGDIRFTQTDLSIVPFNGNENIVFIDSISDSISYKGTIRKSDYNFYKIYENHVESEEDCPGDWYNIENNYTRFAGEINDFDMWFDLNIGGDAFFGSIKKFIFVRVHFIKDYQEWYFGCRYAFDDLKLYDLSPTDNILLTYNDSLNIGPEKFYNVYTFNQIDKPSSKENLQFVYYTVSEGVIGFKTDSGHLWYLIQ